jgi:Uma2 family endonuclease
MSAVERHYVTEAEFLALPESTRRVELFDGEVVVSPAPSPRHQLVLRDLFVAVDAWVRERGLGWEVVFAPVDLRVGRDRILQPDLVVFDRRLPRTATGPVDRVPVLVAEVLSASTADYDRFGKRLAYAEAGVPSLLLVDPEADVVEVFVGDGLRDRTLCRDRLLVPGLDGLDVDLATIFEA